MTARFTDHILPADTLSARPAATAVPAGSLYPATDTEIVYRSDGATWTVWSTGGGGASTAPQLSRLYSPASGSTVIDEFEDAALDPAWVRVDKAGDTARATWTEDAGVLSVSTAGGDAAGEMHALVRPMGPALASGDGFETCFTTFGPNLVNFVMAGMVLANGAASGAGEQLATLGYGSNNAPPPKLDTSITALTGYLTQGSFGALLNTPPYVRTFQRITYRGANQWRQDLSVDGVTWLKSALFTQALIPTYVGLWTSSWGTATAGATTFEYLRRVTGVA